MSPISKMSFLTRRIAIAFYQRLMCITSLPKNSPKDTPFRLPISIWPVSVLIHLAVWSHLILSWVNGLPLSELLPQLPIVEVGDIKRECREAVQVFQDIGIWVDDCGKHNVLYSRDTRKVTVLNFEVIVEFSEEHQRYLESPELVAVYGRDATGASSRWWTIQHLPSLFEWGYVRKSSNGVLVD